MVDCYSATTTAGTAGRQSGMILGFLTQFLGPCSDLGVRGTNCRLSATSIIM